MNVPKKSSVDGKKCLVWAKLRFCSFWPARLIKSTEEIPSEIRNRPRNTECVFFFGSKNYGFVQKSNIVEYESNRSKYIEKGRGKLFEEAVAQMDEFISDPIMFSSNAYLKPSNNAIVVKTERDPIVKTEREIDEVPYEVENVHCQATNLQIDQLKREKEQIIKDLVITKGENQKLILQLQQMKRELDHFKNVSSENNHKLTENIHRITLEMNVLKQQLNSEKSKNQNSSKTITDLQREISLLSAQITSLQSASQQCQKSSLAESENKNKENGVYAVECILAHRVLKRYRTFLVRWENYSSEHDTWVKEKNLYCQEMLKEYLDKNGLSPPKSE